MRTSEGRGGRRLGLSLIGLLTGGFIAPHITLADTASQAAALPSVRAGTSSVFDGNKVYVFGGDTAAAVQTSQIVSFDPVTNAVTTLPSTLPTARSFTSAIFDGQNAYVFGGITGSATRNNQIVRFNPGTGTVTVMSATLPTARSSTSAVWDGEYAYIFGGFDTARSNQILRYDPSTDTLTTLGVPLPVAIQDASAVWNGTRAYLFGGDILVGATANRTNKIVSFDPATGAVTTLATVLPTNSRDRTSAAWVPAAGAALIVGGRGGASDVNGNSTGTTAQTTLIKFDPAAGTANLTSTVLPTASECVGTTCVIGRSGSSAVSDGIHGDGNQIYVFGGIGATLRTAQIVRYEISLGEPTKIDFTLNTGSTGPWGTEIQAEALLVLDDGFDTPLENKTVTFTLSTQTRSAVTDENGLASVNIPLPSTVGTFTNGLKAAFAAQPGLRDSSKTKTVTTSKRLALLSYDGPAGGDEAEAPVAALVKDNVTNAGINAYAVTLSLGANSANAPTSSAGRSEVVFNNVPRGTYTAAASINPTALYDPSPASVSVPYDVDWGYVFRDEGEKGTVYMSVLSNEYQFVGEGGDEIGPTGEGLEFQSTGIGAIVDPAPVDLLAVVTRLEGDTMVGAFDLENLQFLAVIRMENENLYVLRRSCLGDMGTCPQLPTCVFNQSPVSDQVVLHQGPFCP